MPVDILIGLQWGDEGKGKIVDILCPKYKVVARFQGGPNAGHTLEFEGKKHVLNTIPSGIFHKGVKNIIGNGVVVDPGTLAREIRNLIAVGVDARKENNLFLSRKAHLILPTHKLLDAASEQRKGELKIGSTLRGIGPTYQDKAGRRGLRTGDILLPDFEERYRTLRNRHLQQMEALMGVAEGDLDFNLQAEEERWWDGVELLREFPIIDAEHILHQSLAKNESILAEGAQGTLLDVDFGSYPYVTSSSTTAGGACTGLGIPPGAVRHCIGISKAYCTRVGGGPFPTELHDETGERIREIGGEKGATTGRPRRTGWLDLPALKYAVQLNGVTHLVLSKADVLSGFDPIKVCVGYESGPDFPGDVVNQACTPVYKDMPGWQEKLTAIKKKEDLPKALTGYLSFVEKFIGIPVTWLGTGPDRSQLITLGEFKI